jgi:hypothetical protein
MRTCQSHPQADIATASEVEVLRKGRLVWPLAALALVCALGVVATVSNASAALSPRLITVHTSPTNPYYALSITKTELRDRNFVLGEAPATAKVKLNVADASRILVKDFPSEGNHVLPIDRRFLVTYQGVKSGATRSPVLCWAFVVGKSIKGFYTVVSTKLGVSWTLILINAMNGAYQNGVQGHSVIR